MRKIVTLLLITVVFTIPKRTTSQTNVFPTTGSAGIGTTTPNASALLEIKSTTKGLLVSRMTNYDFDGVNHPQNDKDNYSLVYADFVPSLVKAVQELSNENNGKDKKIQELEEKNRNLEERLKKIEVLVLQNNGIPGNISYLKQNFPNPSNATTRIGYSTPASERR